MKQFLKFLFLIPLAFCNSACGGGDEPNGPDINNVNSSLDATFAKLNGKYTATWAESLNDVTYDMTFTPYDTPKNEDIRISDGNNVNFTQRVRIFGKVNVIMTYSFSSGYTHEQSNKNYLYGIESTIGEPYEIIFYPYSSSNGNDMIYGSSTSYYIKNIVSNLFDLSMTGKNGDFHEFKK